LFNHTHLINTVIHHTSPYLSTKFPTLKSVHNPTLSASKQTKILDLFSQCVNILNSPKKVSGRL